MKKILMFEFNSLVAGLAVDRAVAPFDIQVVPVPRKHYNKAMEDLVDEWSEVYDEDSQLEDYAGGPLGGRMLVFCGLDRQLDDVLPALREAGVGPDCLKAVLTDHNSAWDAVKLYGELRREHLKLQGR